MSASFATPHAQPPSPDATASPIPRGTLDPGAPVRPLDDALRELHPPLPPSPMPRGALDPRAPVRPLDDALRELEQDRLAAPVLERYQAGDYAGAAKLGLPMLASGPGQHALRYAVANSLAWTGRYDEAAAQYRQLVGTPYDVRARVGLADVLRWRGQPHLAEPYYLEALSTEPAHKEAAAGLELAQRDLRPAITLRAARTEDDVLRRDELSLSYRRWSADRRFRFEAGVLAGREHSSFGAGSPRGLFASAWSPALPLSPRVEAAYYDSDVGGAKLFGTLQAEPIRDRLKLRAGRVDWGRAAFSAAATAQGLTARTAGLAAESTVRLGRLQGRVDLYDISDGNRIVDAEAQVTPKWQPLPWRLLWSGGLYARAAEREDPGYWSPRPAYSVLALGLQRHWSFDQGEVSASLRHGFALSRTAGDSWSGGVNGRVWLRRDLALGIEAWVVDAPRPASYRVDHVGAFLQHIL